ncbi:MAG: hypothetical protein NTX24_01530 [Candidatus Pacearchaeota archaeon]|nr:hypothetical protein [Candidatus Pacearchaeota archaeon]
MNEIEDKKDADDENGIESGISEKPADNIPDNDSENKEEDAVSGSVNENTIAKTEVLDDKKTEEKKDGFFKRNKKKIIVGIIILAVVILLIVILSMIFFGKTTFETFDYHGMTFEKALFGQIFVYQTNITIAKPNPFTYTLVLRNDPRKLDNIPVNISALHAKGYFSVNSDTLKCGGDTLIAAFQIAQFVKVLGGDIEATAVENFSNNTLPIKTCNDANQTVSVLLLRPFSEQSRIYVDENNSNCMILEAQNCSVAEVSERFILGLLEKNRRSESFTDQIAQIMNES